MLNSQFRAILTSTVRIAYKPFRQGRFGLGIATRKRVTNIDRFLTLRSKAGSAIAEVWNTENKQIYDRI